MRVGIVLVAVVGVLGVGLLGRELLRPLLEIAVQAALIVVDEDGGRDVHGIRQAEPVTACRSS